MLFLYRIDVTFDLNASLNVVSRHFLKRNQLSITTLSYFVSKLLRGILGEKKIIIKLFKIYTINN